MKYQYRIIISITLITFINTVSMSQAKVISEFMQYVEDVSGFDYYPVNQSGKLKGFSSYQMLTFNRYASMDTLEVRYDEHGQVIRQVSRSSDHPTFNYVFEASYYPQDNFIMLDTPETICADPLRYNGHPLLFTSRFILKGFLHDTLLKSLTIWDPLKNDSNIYHYSMDGMDTIKVTKRPIIFVNDLQRYLFHFRLTSLPASYFLCEMDASSVIGHDSANAPKHSLDKLTDTLLTYMNWMPWPWGHSRYTLQFNPPYYTITETKISRIRKRARHHVLVAKVHYDGRPDHITWFDRKTSRATGTKTYTYDQYGNFQLIEVQRPGTKLIRQFNNVYFDQEDNQTEEVLD